MAKIVPGAMAKLQGMETDPGLAAILAHIDKLEGGSVEKFNGLLKPISLRLDEMATSLQNTSQRAEEALLLASKQSDKIGRLHQQTDKNFEQIVILNNKSRGFF